MACWLPGRPGHRTGCQTASVDTLLLCFPALKCPLVCQPTRDGAAARSRLLQLLGSSGQASESGYGPACGVAPSLDICAGRPAHLEGADGDAAAALGECARAAMLPVACRQALKQNASDPSPAEAFSPVRERQIGTWFTQWTELSVRRQSVKSMLCFTVSGKMWKVTPLVMTLILFADPGMSVKQCSKHRRVHLDVSTPNTPWSLSTVAPTRLL